jgi:hypothetical protein
MRATRRTSQPQAPVEPFSAEELATIRAAQASFPFFLMHVFPKSFAGRKFRLADRKYHQFELGAIHYTWAMIAQEHPRVCILAPRGHLKSTVLNHAFSFWKLFRAWQDVDGIVMSFKDTLAQEHTTKIKKFISANPYCRMWTDNKKAAESVVDFDCTFGDGVHWRGQVDPYGIMSTVRGLHPKFLVCFTPDTEVRVSKMGYRPISEVMAGDWVVGHSGKYREVLEAQSRPYDGELVLVGYGRQVIRVTPNHQFLTKRGWIAAGDIEIGDVLETGTLLDEQGRRPRRRSLCEECGASFFVRYAHGQRFCGKGCVVAFNNHAADRTGIKNGRWAGGPAIFTCARDGCEGTRTVTPAKVRYAVERGGVLYCSRKCKNLDWGLRFSGESNPNWRGGSSTRRRAAGAEFTESLREQIRGLYGRSCAWCMAAEADDALGRRLDVHHIDRDRWNNAVDNLVALCRSCHTKTNISTQHDELIKDLVLTHNGQTVVSLGIEHYTGTVYNLNVEEDHTYQLRYNIIVHNCDDILSDFANALEPKQIRRIEAIFTQSLESLPDEDDSLILIGTPQSYEDTLYKRKDTASYFWGRFPAEFGDGQVLWPEKFDQARLARTRQRIKDRAYQVEYMLVPVLAISAFIPIEVIESCVDRQLRPIGLDESFSSVGTLGCYGGMDVGKQVHPTHLAVFALMPTGDLVQVYQEFLDGMDYRSQAKRVRQIIDHFKIRRFYYDNTRAEMEDRNMPRQALGMAFNAKTKAQMALAMESRFYADDDEMGIILLDDRRQTSQIVAVDKALRSVETSDGHGDAFWSNALAIRAADDGPVMQILGDAQEMFGGIRKRNPLLAGRAT